MTSVPPGQHAQITYSCAALPTAAALETGTISATCSPMPSGEGLPAQRGVRVHHLEVEERTVISKLRRNVAEQFEVNGTVQLGVGDDARSEGAVGKVAAPVVFVAPRAELPAQGCRCGRIEAFRVDLIGGDSSPHDREEDVDGT